MKPVVALCVDVEGVYSGFPGVDLWGSDRDIRRYRGSLPAVAHPPCGRWCQLAPLVEATHGIPAGHDGGVFAAALAAVRRGGGVLEHPAWSRAWRAHGLTPPIGDGVWTRARLAHDTEWCTLVAQRHFGHEATKWTWLLVVQPRAVPLPPLPTGPGPPPTAGIGTYAAIRRRGGLRRQKPRLRRLSGRQASATPEPFARLLLSIARRP